MFVVVAVAVTALAVMLPSLLLFSKWAAPGRFGFWTVANVVAVADQRAHAAGIAVGDRIDYSLMPPNERYGGIEDGLRQPPVGKTVSFVIERHGRTHVAVLTAQAVNWIADDRRVLFWIIAVRATFIVLVLLGSALYLIRPTALTAGFFLFSVGDAYPPVMYFFLPLSGYAVVMVMSDALIGLGAIGFLVLAIYLDPSLYIRSRAVVSAAVVLFAVIVVPLATSDVFELAVGTRPAWPLAGWASFSTFMFCHLVGFFLLLRLAISTFATRILRLLAVLLAAIGAVKILDDLPTELYAWYFANLPLALINRPWIPNDWVATYSGWHLALRVLFALGVSYAVIQITSFRIHPRYFRIAAFAGLTLILTFFLRPAGVVDVSLLLKTLGGLLAFYVIVHAGVADTGPVLSRVAAYIIAVLLVIATFMAVNLVFAPMFSGYTLIVPFEILAAIATGYWVSGLRDLAGCLSLACVDAWRAWAKGRSREEREAFAKALALAERTRRRGIIAEVRAQIAFAAWRDGEDYEFEQNAGTLQRLLDGHNERGLGGFAIAAISEDDQFHFKDGDLPEWKSRAALVLCARSNDASRVEELAKIALEDADRAGLPSLQVLASIAVAETSFEHRNSALARAHAIARDAGWTALSKSVLALRANARDIGILQSFVHVRLRKSRPARPAFRVAFFSGELYQNDIRVSLSEKELELLLTVASSRTGINDKDVIDALWPESDGDAARISFRVCLHRLRKNAGDARIVTRVGKGYVVHPWADVDLWRLQSTLSKCRGTGGVEGTPELIELCDSWRAGQGQRATLGEWFYRFEQMLQRNMLEAQRLLARSAISQEVRRMQ